MYPPFPRSMLVGMPGEMITDDHRAKALLQAKDTLQKLDALRKELGIPHDQLYLVVDMYSGHLQTLVNVDAHERQRARRKKLKTKYAAQSRHPAFAEAAPFAAQSLGMSDYYFDDDEEE